MTQLSQTLKNCKCITHKRIGRVWMKSKTGSLLQLLLENNKSGCIRALLNEFYMFPRLKSQPDSTFLAYTIKVKMHIIIEDRHYELYLHFKHRKMVFRHTNIIIYVWSIQILWSKWCLRATKHQCLKVVWHYNGLNFN